jgi:hypothetical protein
MTGITSNDSELKEAIGAGVREALNGKDARQAYEDAGEPKGWANFRKALRKAKEKLAPAPAR